MHAHTYTLNKIKQPPHSSHSHNMFHTETTASNIPQSGCTESHRAMHSDVAAPWGVHKPGALFRLR